MRVAVWTSLAIVLAISVFVWMKFLSEKTLIQNLERRPDNMTYERGDNIPFNGTAYGYFIDDTLWEKVDFVDGIREGIRTVWHINGNVALQETYSSGFLQSAASFDFNGAQTDSFEDGNGAIMLYWNDTGIRSQELVYKNHVIVKRTIWDREGLLLSMIPPELPPTFAFTPPIVINPSSPTITNSVLPTNQIFTITNKPAIDITPDPEMLGRTRGWVMSNPRTTSSRVAIDRHINLIYINKKTNTLIKVFGYPDEVITYPSEPVQDWKYGEMNVKNIQGGGYLRTIYFQIDFEEGRVSRVSGTPYGKWRER